MARNFAAISSTKRLRRFALAGRRLLHLEAVLVGAGEEEHVVAVDALEARDRVRGDHLVGVADMRRPVRIGDRRREIELVSLGHPAILPKAARPSARSADRVREIAEAARSPPAVCRDCRCSASRAARVTFSHTSTSGARRAAPALARASRPFDTQAMAVSRASSRSPSVPRGETFSASRTTRFMSSRGSSSRRALVSATMPDLSSSSSVTARRTEPSAKPMARVRSASAVSASGGPSERMTAARSASPRGRSSSLRQRERIVGRSRCGAWLTTRKIERGGGSSMTLRSALPLDGLRSSAASTMQMR